MALKKVRIRNNTTDGTSIRVFVDHIDPTIRAIFDVQSGSQQQNNHMTPGHRGVIVYDDFQETVIATGDFVLAGSNVQMSVSGDAAGGYTIAYATFAP